MMMILMNKLRIGRLLLLIVIVLSTKLAFIFLDSVDYNPIAMSLLIPFVFYMPVMSFIALLLSFKEGIQFNGSS